MDADDRIAITDLINLHGHLVDSGERYDELFTPDVEYDVSGLGGGVIAGREALWEAGLALGENNPVGHHVTNIVLTQVGPDEVTARSKAIGIMANGSCASLVYEDVVVRTPDGWLISRRAVVPRRRPLGR
ncbi:nuclear transport factor 2 family protein [Kribbella speibonae]|uniref:Nuclear transport factor 2 family protein n=1 Tax=Kribbella speibonae TaxID=1572660 RepID=A0ABY2AEC9_9ACTN|nr:nuclear transport factor 2 family protein [Kribbella speibonae]TCC27387.1 nuclear transport factor 2 family protein [Kribbella speibonae]